MNTDKSPINKIVGMFQRFEYFVSILLAVLLAAILCVAVMRVAIFSYLLIFSKIVTPTEILYEDFNNIFGKILTLFITIEFMNSILRILRTGELKRLVVDVTLITGLAITRKLIILDYSNTDHMTIIAMGIVLVSVGIFYFLVRIETLSKYLRNKNKEPN